jgi:predicted membrane channel-forming protein YqfA (hemolysin III family)
MIPSDLWAKIRAAAGALSAKLAYVQGLLVAAATIVPFLPIAWQAKAAAWLALAGSWVAALVALVARVTPVPDEARSVLLPTGQRMRVELVGKPFPAGHVPPT